MAYLFMQWNITQQLEVTDHPYMQQVEWILKTLCLIKGARHKGVHIVLFHFYEVLE